MIASVRGTVASVGVDHVVVEVGGVGLSVLTTPATLASLRVGVGTRLATSLVVREDSLTLFGFADDDEKALFELLLTATGVGPKLAQAALATMAPDTLRAAILDADLMVLTRIPGVGKKGAERMVLELKDKVMRPSGPALLGPTTSAPVVAWWRAQLRGGLVGLGWSDKEADRALDAVADELGPDVDPGAADLPALLRRCLAVLGGTR